MSCKVKTKTISYLKDQGAITDKKVIANPAKFKELNEELTNLAYHKYNVGNGKLKLFNVVQKQTRDVQGNYINRFVHEPNESLFTLLDEAVNHHDEIHAKIAGIIAKRDTVKDPNAKEKYFAESDTQDLSSVLSKIADSEHALAPLAKKLAGKLKRDIKIKLVDNIEGSSTAENPIGVYDSSSSSISIKKDAIYRGTGVENTILHEALHYFTQEQLVDHSTEEAKFLDELRTHALKYMKAEDWYALTNLDEMAVGLFTDAKFIEALKAIPPMQTDKKFGNAFEEILNYILGLLKLTKGNTAYEQAATVVASLIEKESARQEEQLDSFYDFSKNLPPMYQMGAPKFNLQEMFGEEETTKLETKAEENEAYEFESTPALRKTAQELEDEAIASEEDVEASANISEKRIHLRDVNEKLDYSLKQINKSIDISLAKYKHLQNIYKTKDIEKADAMAEHAMNLKALQDDINSYQDVERIRAVVTFVEKMHGNMDYVKKKLDNVDPDNPKEYFYAIKNYEAYLNAYGVIEILESNLAYIRNKADQNIISAKDLDKIEKKVVSAKAEYGYLKKRVYQMMVTYVKHTLNDIQFHSRVEHKHKERLRKEHNLNKVAEDFDSWYPKIMRGRDKEMVAEDLKDAINSLVEDPSFDMSAGNTWMNSAINSSSTMVQIFNQLFTKLKNKRLPIETEADREIKGVWEEVTKAKGTNAINELYKNILEYSKDGAPYLKGEYSAGLLEIRTQIKDLATKRVVALREGINSAEFKEADAAYEKLVNANFDKVEGALTPKSKWKNNLDSLSEVDRKMLKLFTDLTDNARSNTYGKNSLITKFNGASFYSLPKVTKSQAERMWTGKLKGTGKDLWKDLTTVRADDIGFTEVNTDGAGNEIKEVPIHYRGKLDPDQQSLDLFSIYRLEFKNGVNFKIRNEMELELGMMVEISKNTKYYKTQGTRRRVDRKTGLLDTKEGYDSETYKMMQNMLETKLYDMLHKTGNKINKIDLNKAVGFINGVTSFLGMTLNIASGTANIVNANAQMFLEGFIKGHFITADGIKKANQIYGRHLKDTLKDNTRPIADSFVSQLNEYFHVEGLLNLSDANFLQSDLMKAGLSTKALQVFQSTGEHWIQSVVTMSVLQGVKVMDKNNNFIDKDGNVVATKKEAASVLDMMERNERGAMVVSDKVVYTTHSAMSEWQNGGKEKVDMLIRKKLFDSLGNYTKDAQPEIQRHWWGKLSMMYRKYLIPMGVARFRGIEYSDIDREELDEGQDRYSYALQEKEEGTYTSLVRYIISAFKSKQYNLLSTSNWSELSDYHKHNVKRATVELTVSFAIIPMVLMAMQAMADDDDDLLYFTMYQLRRLDTELSQYINPSEMFKIIRSPIPSVRTVETALSAVGSVFSFNMDDGEFNYGLLETYDQGRFKGQNKALINIGKNTPGIKEFIRKYADLYDFQNSNWGTGL